MAVVAVIPAYSSIFDKYTINRSALPQEAVDMIETHFPKAAVSSIKIDRHLLKKTDYDVKLTNGVTLEFSNKGKWTSIDCGKKEVPEDLVPAGVKRYMKKNLSSSKIVSLVKKSTGYEVGIDDGRILKFDLLGTFKGETAHK